MLTASSPVQAGVYYSKFAISSWSLSVKLIMSVPVVKHMTIFYPRTICRSLFLLSLLSAPAALPAAPPDVELVRLDGETRSMADYIGQDGKWTVINVWSPDCSACVRELPHLEAFRKKYRDKVNMLGLTIDFPSFAYGKMDVTRKFVERNPIHYPLFLADMDSVAEVIGNRLVAIPLIAIYHPNGEVLARWPGYVDTREIEEFMANHEEYSTDDPLSFDE